MANQNRNTIIIIAVVIVLALVLFNSGLINFNSQAAIGAFSVVGDNRGCGLSHGNPDKEITLAANSVTAFSGADICTSGYAVLDLFIDKPWAPYMEYNLPYSGSINCPAGSTCTLQIYCCPKKECTSNSDCGGATCNQIQCSAWKNGGYQCPTEFNIPYFKSSYSYCTPATSITCYYKQNGVCNTRTYSTGAACSEMGSPPGFYQGMKLYSSSSECSGAVECTNQCSPSTGTQCSGTQISTCVKNGDCYQLVTTNCPTGQSCSNGVCTTGGGGGECAKDKTVFNVLGLKYTPTGCNSCGTGTLNLCDTPECTAIGMYLGINCSWNSAGTRDAGNLCIKGTGCQSGAVIGVGESLSQVKKIALSKEAISTSTNDMLLASACLFPSECITTNSSQTVSCESIAALRSEGTLTAPQSNSFFSHADSVLSGAATGTAIGGSLGVIVCGVSGVLALIPAVDAVTIPIAITVCTAAIPGGISSGAAIGAATGYIYPSSSDDLVKKLQAADANSVGICMFSQGSDLCKYTSWAALFNITGNKCTDGGIILGILVLIGIIILTRM